MKVYSLSRTLTRQGAGLGNELIPAAKSYLCSQRLGLPLIAHPWGKNPRGYRNIFGVSHFDGILPTATKQLIPNVEIKRSDWISHRLIDYGDLCEKVIDHHRFPWYAPAGCIVHAGMWGGYVVIDPAKPWIRSLLNSAKGAKEYLYNFEKNTSGSSFRIGVHIRRGDFSPLGEDVRGRFNVSIPLMWYRNVIQKIAPILPENPLICLFSDSEKLPVEELVPAGRRGIDIWKPDPPGHDTGDLLALASCDLIVCSISSFSLMAAWLGDKPYIWLQDQMHIQGDRLSLWGDEADSGNWLQRAAYDAAKAERRSPCIPFSLDGIFSVEHLSSVLVNGFSPLREHNPLLYGCTW